MHAGTGAQEADHFHADAVDLPEAAGLQVGDVEDLSVRRELHVLRHPGPAVGQVERAHDPLALDVDLHQLARELAAGERVPAVGREVHVVDARARHHERMVQAEAVRVTEVEPMEPFGDDDRIPPVRCEVHVVRVVDRNRRARLAGLRIDRRQAVAEIVRDVERLQVVRRCDVLRERTDGEVFDDLEGLRVDHVDGRALAVGDVDARQRGARDGREHVRAVVRVHVAGRGRRDACGHPPGPRRPRP